MTASVETTLFDPPRFEHHGATDGVTGSCHRYRLAADYSVLIDCGLFQGEERGAGESDEEKNRRIDFEIKSIKAVIITHVHIDHCGRLPFLYAAGYRGPIYCTQASAKLLPLVLKDALKTGVGLDLPQISRFITLFMPQVQACEYGQWVDLPPFAEPALQRTLENTAPTANAATATQTTTPPAQKQTTKAPSFRFQVAGHILGSAYVEFKHRLAKRWYKTVFSGDIGPPHTPLLPAPKPPIAADVVVLESTYGDRCHQGRRQRRQQLQRMIEQALQDNGTILIPAFSIGRTQELLYELEAILHTLKHSRIHAGLAWSELDIVVDAPLAAAFTNIYRELSPYWDREAKRLLAQGRHPLDFSQFITVQDHQQHLALVNYLASTNKPAIVIASSGMCTGGRIVNYLTKMMENPLHQIMFCGYQARGTPGAAIIKAATAADKTVYLQGRAYQLRAEVLVLGGFSAHADQQDLIRFILGMRKRPSEIRLVHGDTAAKLALQRQLTERGYFVSIPRANTE